MDLHNLFLSCRKGDLEKIKYLVEQKEVEVNTRDKWDSTPLYYACLCGHIEVVQYLLENGAKCEANTFDGERCIYGALDPEIRNLLKNFKVVSSQTIRRELYHEFLRKLLEDGDQADVCFMVHGREFYLHKCILSSRSDYFYEMLTEKWGGRTTVHITHELVNPFAFQSVVQYLYTGQLETHVDHIGDVLRLAKHCKMTTLEERIEDVAKKAHFFQTTKPGTNVTSIQVEQPANSCELKTDFSILADQALPPAFSHWVGSPELPFCPEERAPFADVVFLVQNHKFFCHKAFFCARSEYFKTLIRNPLGEDEEESGSSSLPSHLPQVRLRHFGVSVFLHILYYIYQDSVELIPSVVNEVLMAADLCLLPGLKRLCGVYIAEFLDTNNVINMLRTARLFDIPKLEDHCYMFIADYLEEMMENFEFHQLIREDASEVADREDVDSIDVIDNVRYHLTASSMDEAHDSLALIDELLETLSLDA